MLRTLIFFKSHRSKQYSSILSNHYRKAIKLRSPEDSDNISAGEKQLLTIARAMIADPPMMILDEATSNVDTRTEQLIKDAFVSLRTVAQVS